MRRRCSRAWPDGKSSGLESSGCRCALVGVPRCGSVSARFARGDIQVSLNMLSKVLKMLSILRRHGTPMRPTFEAWKKKVASRAGEAIAGELLPRAPS